MKHKSISKTTDCFSNLTSFERHIEFIKSRNVNGRICQLHYNQILKSHFKPESK
jgi:hypothetical protein